MVHLTMEEAQLFRILAAFFGHDQVMHRISVFTICGGALPENYAPLLDWSREYRCLFTVTDAEGDPKLAVDFVSDTSSTIDVHDLENRERVRSLCKAQGVHYVPLTHAEFAATFDAEGEFDFCQLLASKIDGDLLAQL
jgi:hypothetical protein